MAQLEFRDESFRGSHRSSFVGGHAECSTDAMSNDTMTGEKKARSVQLYFVLIMLCTGRALDRIANAPWRMLFQAYSPKINARLVVMMLGVLAFFFLGHKRCGEQSGDDGTEDQRVREKNANIEIPKIGIVIRQAEEGPMRTHLIMNSHRLATHQDIKTEVTNVKQAQSAVKARSGDAMDVDAFTKGSKGASKGSGKKQDSEVVCLYCDARRKVIELPIVGRSKGTTTVVSRKVPRKATAKGRATRTSSKANATSVADRSKGCRSKETSAFEAGDELAETGCIEMASVDLNALEIGAVQLPEKGHRIRLGIDSCAAVTVFPKSVADDCPMLDMPGKAKSYRPASGKLLPVKLGDAKCLKCVNSRDAVSHRALTAVSETNDMGHDVFFPWSDRGILGVRVPREQWHETGARESEWSVRVASRNCPVQPQYIEEQHFRLRILHFLLWNRSRT